MKTINVYRNLAVQRASIALCNSFTALPSNTLDAKPTWKSFFKAAAKTKKAICRLQHNEQKKAGALYSHTISEKANLANFYARELLTQSLSIKHPTENAIELYGNKLKRNQRPSKALIEKNSAMAIKLKRALIISQDPLEQNVLDTFFRNMHIMPEQVKSKAALLRQINKHFEIVIVSESFKPVDAHAIAQILKATHEDTHPLLILLTKSTCLEYKALGFDLLVQHPFPLDILKESIKDFFALTLGY